MSLQTVITLLLCLVIILALTITGVLIGMKEAQNARNDLSEKAIDVAQIVANTPLVIRTIDLYPRTVKSVPSGDWLGNENCQGPSAGRIFAQ